MATTLVPFWAKTSTFTDPCFFREKEMQAGVPELGQTTRWQTRLFWDGGVDSWRVPSQGTLTTRAKRPRAAAGISRRSHRVFQFEAALSGRTSWAVSRAMTAWLNPWGTATSSFREATSASISSSVNFLSMHASLVLLAAGFHLFL